MERFERHAETDAYEKVKMVPKGEGLVACGVTGHCFTDVSGLGLAEQVRRLLHPCLPKKEEDLSCVNVAR